MKRKGLLFIAIILVSGSINLVRAQYYPAGNSFEDQMRLMSSPNLFEGSSTGNLLDDPLVMMRIMQSASQPAPAANSNTNPTQEFQNRIATDPIIQTQMQLANDALNRPRVSSDDYTVISINGVEYRPGLNASYTTGSGENSSNGHITQSQLNRAIDAANKSAEEYYKNPTSAAYDKMKADQKVVDTYQKSLQHK